jgi:steroid 5-alpha reductase family enzyme
LAILFSLEAITLIMFILVTIERLLEVLSWREEMRGRDERYVEMSLLESQVYSNKLYKCILQQFILKQFILQRRQILLVDGIFINIILEKTWSLLNTIFFFFFEIVFYFNMGI